MIPLLHCNGLSCSHHCTENTSHISHDMSQTHTKIYCKVLHIEYSKFIKGIFHNIIHTSCDLMKSNNIKTIKTKIHLLCLPSPSSNSRASKLIDKVCMNNFYNDESKYIRLVLGNAKRNFKKKTLKSKLSAFHKHFYTFQESQKFWES